VAHTRTPVPADFHAPSLWHGGGEMRIKVEVDETTWLGMLPLYNDIVSYILPAARKVATPTAAEASQGQGHECATEAPQI